MSDELLDRATELSSRLLAEGHHAYPEGEREEAVDLITALVAQVEIARADAARSPRRGGGATMTDELLDLLDRLREMPLAWAWCYDVADHIEALVARVEELQRTIDRERAAKERAEALAEAAMRR